MLGDELAIALQPLHSAFESAGALRDFLEDLGWDFDVAPAAIDRLRTPVEQVFAILSDPDGIDASDLPRILTSVRAVLDAISGLASVAELAADFKNEFPRQLVDYLVVDYLLHNQPRVGYLLMGLGIVSVAERPRAGTRLPYVFHGFAWERLPELLRDPRSHLKSAYRWGQSDFDSARLIASLAGFLEAWHQRVSTDAVDQPAAASLNNGAVQPDASTDAVLRLILLEDAIDAALVNCGVGLFLLPETASAMPGFAVLPFATAGLTEEFPLSSEFSLAVRGNVDLAGGAGVLVRPGRDVEFLLGLASGTPAPASGTFAFALRYASAAGRFIPIGSEDGSRFELATLSTSAGARLSSRGAVDAFAEFALKQAKVVIKPDSGTLDGFLSSVLPAKGIELDTGITVGLSSDRGIYFAGTGGDSIQSALEAGAGLDATLPVNLSAGPVTLRSVHIRLAAGNDGLTAEVSASVQATFGPVSAVIERVGLTLDVDFPRGGSAPAPLDANGGFKAPSGVALSVDATGVMTGGGFLFHDAAQGLYAGAMQLSLHEQITLKAFGLIATRMPDGSRGYSLIVFITAEDFRPIPLGLGFTLLGIGGMVGVNRTFDERGAARGTEAAARSRRCCSLAIRSATRATLIRGLSSAFPARRGSYLLGLIAKIGWFTPTLVLMDLALILEFGSRQRLLALGRISALLPSADNDLVRLNLEAMGVIDFDAGTAAIDAELVDSRLAHKFPITGAGGAARRLRRGPWIRARGRRLQPALRRANDSSRAQARGDRLELRQQPAPDLRGLLRDHLQHRAVRR